jgi:hypothetical protein
MEEDVIDRLHGQYGRPQSKGDVNSAERGLPS